MPEVLRTFQSHRMNLVAGAWGFAEATMFFVVPDVWITVAAKDRLVPGLWAAAAALGGAVAGGLLMYKLSAHAPDIIVPLVESVPTTSRSQVENSRLLLQDEGAWAMVKGPLTGTPYKVYAVGAPGADVSLWTFLLWSIPARLPRFIATAVLAHLALGFLAGRGWIRSRTGALLGFWLVFYAVLLTVMPW